LSVPLLAPTGPPEMSAVRSLTGVNQTCGDSPIWSRMTHFGRGA
jgi:hypothetical protein